jgi:8-amino-7-oxononanoate synthase
LALCELYDAWLYVDDAHGFGVLGGQGRGSLAHFGIASPRIIYMATLGKAAGVSGAFVAAEHAVVDTLVNHAHSYVYTTAAPPALSVALLQSLQLIGQGDVLRAHLHRLIAQLRRGLADLPWPLLPSETAIQPLLIGDNRHALALSEALRTRGILVAAIRPPTVPQGTARLRITLSAAHTEQDVEQLVGALHELAC